ncbi:hypothetical protein WJX72_005248 [[Myrmecia] bisecta]|uniref:Uncharacterized protein n=1 Tax=[Myrmecia] bisecta TaxID=41462 RepID=A0AAW1PA89_9CHLO
MNDTELQPTQRETDSEMQRMVELAPQTALPSSRRLVLLLLALATALFAFVFIPVVVDLPWVNEPWFNLADAWKLLDPLFTVPLHYLVYAYSPAFAPVSRLTVVFMAAVGLYVDGHGLHTACTIFKDPIQYQLNSGGVIDSREFLQRMYQYIRGDWEHVYSHYIYLVGALAMSFVHVYAFKDAMHAELQQRMDLVLFWAGVMIYAVLVAGTAINFPYGLIAGLIWICLFAGSWAFWLYHQPDPTYKPLVAAARWKACLRTDSLLFSRGKKLVMQWYLAAYGWALLLILLYICIYGFKSRSAAGL